MGTAAQARVAAGIACRYLSVLLMNQLLFPLLDPVFAYTRDVAITASSLTLIGVAVLVMWHPHLVGGRHVLPAIVGVSVLATGLVGAGLALGRAWLLVPAACVALACRSLLCVSADLAAVSLPAERLLPWVALGVLAAHAADMLLVGPVGLNPQLGALLAVAVLPLATLALCWPAVRALLGVTASSEPAAELSITRPASFLPLTSTLYVFQFIVYVAFGLALRFGEVDGSPSFSVAFSTAALAALLLAAVLHRKKGPALDALCNLVVLILLAGLMLLVAHVEGEPVLANTVLLVGNALYGVFITCLLVTLAQRNPAHALSIFGWASGIGSLGTTLGALVGTTANSLVAAGSARAASYLVVALAVLLVGYVLFVLRRYSFADQIAAVEEAPAVREEPRSPSSEDVFAARCHAIAQLHGLTPREEETFAMLARGRNREYIENALQVSRNTVKAHVKHVYAKLDIHSHQELLDLVEQGE